MSKKKDWHICKHYISLKSDIDNKHVDKDAKDNFASTSKQLNQDFSCILLNNSSKHYQYWKLLHIEDLYKTEKLFLNV